MQGRQQCSGQGVEGGRQRDEKVRRGSLVCGMVDHLCQEEALVLHRVQGHPVQTGEQAEGQRPGRQENGDGSGSAGKPDENHGKNQQPQPHPGKNEPELSGRGGLLKHQSENIVSGDERRRVKADLGRVDMRVQPEIGRGVAGLVYQAEAVLAGW